MVLSDRDIGERLAYGNLDCEPLSLDEQLQASSLDFRLGNEFAYYVPDDCVDTHDMSDLEVHKFTATEDDGVKILPNGFYLGTTKEKISLPDDLAAKVCGRSSFGRIGIEIHSTAGWIDSGFEGEITLEISNNLHSPVRIYPGQRVGQFVFYELSTPCSTPYGEKDNKYHQQEGAVHSKVYEDS